MYKVRLCDKLKHMWGYKYTTNIKVEIDIDKEQALKLLEVLKENAIKVIECNYKPEWRNAFPEDIYVVKNKTLKNIYKGLEYTFFDEFMPACIFLLGDYLKWYKKGYVQVIEIPDQMPVNQGNSFDFGPEDIEYTEE